MLSTTAKRFKPASVGDNVAIPIPDVDKGRAEFRNVLGVITNVSDNGNYVIGTSHGTLKQKYARPQFIPAKGSFLKVDAIPEDNISLREVARKATIGGGQGYRSCICVKGCESKHCSCRRAGRLCNSKCHGSLSCKNK